MASAGHPLPSRLSRNRYLPLSATSPLPVSSCAPRRRTNGSPSTPTSIPSAISPRPGGARLREPLPAFVEVQAREQHGDHLLGAPVPEPEPPHGRRVGPALAPEERGPRHAADAGLLRARCAVVIVDAKVEVPGAGIHRQV